jgi:hypothetical protein
MFEFDGETYYTATVAATYLGITRFMFYYNVKDHVIPYRFPATRRFLYKKSELEPFRIVEALPVALSTVSARS